MSTVVAVARDGQVVMAADTLTSVSNRPVFGAAKICKVQVGQRYSRSYMLLGVVGDGAMPSIIQARLEVDSQPAADASDSDVHNWAAMVAWRVSDLAVEAGLAEAGRMSSTLLMGWQGRLWTVVHMQAIAHPDGVAAVGSGMGPAIGALDVLLGGGLDPVEAAVSAVKVAAVRDIHTGGDVQVEVLGP